jgi:hypothetical protein
MAVWEAAEAIPLFKDNFPLDMNIFPEKSGYLDYRF